MLVAARELGRDYFAIEIDVGHHATAMRRLAAVERATP